MLCFRVRTYKKFFRVRVPIQPQKEARWNEKSSWIAADDKKRLRFINPHRLFHGVWLPQWLEERPEVSEKAKKLYAYLTYFAGGKGYAWPSFNHLAEKLHISRRYVIRLVQELSAHGLITVNKRQHPSEAIVRITTDFSGIPGCRPSRREISAWRFAKNSRHSEPQVTVNPSHPLVNSRSLALVTWRTLALVTTGHPPGDPHVTQRE